MGLIVHRSSLQSNPLTNRFRNNVADARAMCSPAAAAYNWKWLQALSSISRRETLEGLFLTRDRQVG